MFHLSPAPCPIRAQIDVLRTDVLSTAYTPACPLRTFSCSELHRRANDLSSLVLQVDFRTRRLPANGY